MINRGYAGGSGGSAAQQTGRDRSSNEDANGNAASVRNAVATLLGQSAEQLEPRDEAREMLMNLVRQEALENAADQSFESDNQWLSRSEQSSPSSSSPQTAAQMRMRSPDDDQGILPRQNYFAAPTPII